MCKFCEKQKGLIFELKSKILNIAKINNGKQTAFTEIFDNSLMMTLDDGENLSTVSSIEINYCPMRGRKL